MPKQTQFKPKQTQFQKPKILWLAKLSTAPAVKKFHLMLVLHRRIVFNSGSSCEMDMVATFAKEGKIAARQPDKLTFWDPLEHLTRLR